ncbi:MAG: Ig-like domain-containing protein, partial [Bacilli bacterium]|nr:Ig-like domain-containing protein [Bacilli bacterium]
MGKRRRKRIRFDRIFLCLVFLVGLGFLIRFTIYTVLNFNVYKDAKKGNTITLQNKTVNIWKKTILYINENMDDVNVKYGTYTVTMDSSYLKKNMNIKPSTEIKKITKGDFNKQRGLVINNNNITEVASKIKLKLPYTLYKKGYIDLYGIDEEGHYNLLESKNKTDKYYTLNIYDGYKSYFITYVKLDEIKTTQSITLEEGDTKEIKLQFYPSNATNKKVKYYGYDKDIISYKNGVITALKEGKTTI